MTAPGQVKRYRIAARGESLPLGGVADGLQIESGRDCTSVVAPVGDQSQLWGLLGRLQDHAIHLVAISELGAAVWGDGFLEDAERARAGLAYDSGLRCRAGTAADDLAEGAEMTGTAPAAPHAISAGERSEDGRVAGASGRSAQRAGFICGIRSRIAWSSRSSEMP